MPAPRMTTSRCSTSPCCMRGGREQRKPCDRVVRAAQRAGVQLEDMPAPWRDLAAHAHAGGLQRIVQLHGLVVQQLVGAGLDQHRRQAAQVGLQRRGPGVRRGGVAQAQLRAGARPAHAEHGFAGRLLRRCALHRHVGPGRQQQQGGRGGIAGITQGERERQGQAAAGRVAAHHHGAAGAQRAVGRQCILHRRGEGVLGREPVVRGEQRHAAGPGQPRSQRPVRGRRADAIGAAVQVQQGAGARGRHAGPHPFAGHTADGRGHEARAARRRRGSRQHAQPETLEGDRHARREHRFEQQPQRASQQGGNGAFQPAARRVVFEAHRRRSSHPVRREPVQRANLSRHGRAAEPPNVSRRAGRRGGSGGSASCRRIPRRRNPCSAPPSGRGTAAGCGSVPSSPAPRH